MGGEVMKKEFSFFLIFSLLFVFAPVRTRSQTDSLVALLKDPGYQISGTITDSSRYFVLMDLGQQLLSPYPDSALNYFNQAKEIAGGMKNNFMKSNTLEEIGFLHSMHGNNPEAKKNFAMSLDLIDKCLLENCTAERKKKLKKVRGRIFYNTAQLKVHQGDHAGGLKDYQIALKMFDEAGNKKGMAAVLGNIGIVYDEEGNGSRALEYYFRSLKINEETGQKTGQAANLANIGIVYFEQNDYTTALTYYQKALAINREIGNKLNEGHNLSSIGNIYVNTGRTNLGYDHFLRAKELYKEMNSPEGLANIGTNLALVFTTKADSFKKAGDQKSFKKYYKTALDYHAYSLKYNIELENKNGIAMNYVNIGSINKEIGNYSEAESFLKRSYLMAKEIRSLEELKFAHESFYELYKITGRPKEALENYELFIQYRDSLVNEDNSKAAIRMELKFNYQKQAAADSVAHAKESEVKSAEISRQSAEIKAKKNQQYALFGGLFLVILFSIFMFNRFKVTQKQKIVIEQQKEIVEDQKHLVEEKQKEILDSIQYARRIQLAQIPSEKRVMKMLERLMK
jgi:tetratricopeptide (TPR) repeat protein